MQHPIYALDYETYCDVSIKDVGLDNYVNHPSFQPLFAKLHYETWASRATRTFYLMEDTPGGPQWNELHDYLQWNNVAAHNSEFEARISNRFMHDMESVMWIDTAVISRHLGGSSALEKAAVQFLPVNKVEAGKALIKKFCMGGLKTYDQYTQDPDWTDFEYYCSTDAALSWRLAQYHSLSSDEISFNSITTAMNRTGWYVDVAEVEQMQELADKNKSEALALFQYEHDPKGELNLNSLKQMKEWCLARGVSATSFSEDAVVKLLAKFAKREETHGLTEGQKDVRFMLQTKLTLGGSSLSKLEVIKRLVSKDGRLRDQYMHAGAGQSMRTSGRGVQMQNLKRLTNKLNMDDRYVLAQASNDELASNIRQLFKAEHPEGQLIVGDFSAVESRGLAYLADEEWKLDEFRKGRDLYKVLAAKKYGVAYEDVDSEMRRFGKVGELSCGYGAGAVAVRTFAAGMGIELTDREAQEIVTGWREVNSTIVDFWAELDEALHIAVGSQQTATLPLAGGLHELKVIPMVAPDSLLAMHPGAVSLQLSVRHSAHRQISMQRYFVGCHLVGNNIGYYKPNETIAGKPWKNTFRDPKTGQTKRFTIYGGKLAGILTQSFCRELFFRVLRYVSCDMVYPNLKLIGQFHDEIVLEWSPIESVEDREQAVTLEYAVKKLERLMSTSPMLDFPLAAEVKYDHRYTK
jgi:DNA polymerase